MLSVNEVVRIFRVHPATVRRWAREGKLRCSAPGRGGRLSFKYEDVLAEYLVRPVPR